MPKDVSLTRHDTSIHIGIYWQTEALSSLDIPRTLPGQAHRTDPRVLERIRELAATHTDTQIAVLLNQEGLTPGMGGTFSRSKVEGLRYINTIPTGCPQRATHCLEGQRGDGRYSAQAAADLLNVTVTTIAKWCKSGRLDGAQEMRGAPWWVKLTPEIIAELRKPVRKSWTNRSPA